MPLEHKVPSWEEFQALQQLVQDQAKQVQFLTIITDPWVDAAKAAKITQRDEKTLRIERERPGSLLKYYKEGNTVRYSLASLQAFNLKKWTPALETAQRAAEALRPQTATA